MHDLNINLNRKKYSNNARFNNTKFIFPRLTPVKTVTNTLFYLWHGVVLQSGNEFEVEAAASAQKYRCREPNLQDTEFFKTLLPTSKHMKHVQRIVV